MIKSPNKMTAEQRMLDGNALVNQADLMKAKTKSAGGTVGDAVVGGLEKVGKAIVGKKDEAEQVKKDGQELATTILDAGGGLGNNDYDAFNKVIKDLAEQNNQYEIDKDKEGVAKNGTRMKELKVLTEQAIELKLDIAKTFDTQSVDGKEMPNFTQNLSADDQNLFKAAIDPNTPVKIEDVDGKWVRSIEYNGKWYTKQQLQNKLADCKEDVVSINQVQKLRDVVMNQALSDVAVSSGGEKYGGFDYDANQLQVNKILKTANLVSLINDDMLGTASNFKQDMFEYPAINNLTYKDVGLGVGPNPYDTDGDGRLSVEEAKKMSKEDKEKIIDALTNRDNDFFKEDVTRGLMSRYITNHLQKQYDNKTGYGNAVKKAQYNVTDEDVLNNALNNIK